MDLGREVQGILALRAGRGRMPEVYEEAVSSSDPLAALSELWSEYNSATKNQSLVDTTRRDLDSWQKEGIGVIPLGVPEYPSALLTIFHPPPVLFVKGTLRFHPLSIAIVGSRSADTVAFSAARAIATTLSRCSTTIISGLALGVDTAAHRGSLEESENPIPTVAVLGTGLDRVYPAANRDLAQTIVERGGALLSQFEPGSEVFPSNFIARNQIIAGLSRGVVVIQAAKSSGSLATARFALEEGRDVFVVPGLFGDKRYEGSHQLIRDGATVVTDPSDLLSFYSLERPVDREPDEDSPILAGLRGEESLTIEELARRTRIELNALETALLELEISGSIERLPGNRIRLGHLN